MRAPHLRVRSVRAVLALLLPFALLGPTVPAVGAASSCVTTTASGGYTIGVCLSPSGGTATGTVTVQASVTLSSPTPKISYAVFCLDGTLTSSPSCIAGGPGYLLHDFHYQSAPSSTQTKWSFKLPTAHWIDGTHTLLAVVVMRDGTQSKPVATTVTFSNGKTTQPINNASPKIATGTSSSSPVVAAVGDAAAGESNSTKVASLVKGWSPNLFLYLGDVYEMGSYAEFTNWYASAYGSIKSITDPVIGNHEYLSATDPGTSSQVVPAHTGYFDYWNNIPDYYSFDAFGWHFIALNTNSTPMGSTKWNAELSWLQSDLSSHAGACTIAYFHHPAFNTGKEPIPGSATRLWSMLAGKATLVLNGHDHTYQRWKAMDATGTVSSSGTVEVIDGTGGHSVGSFVTTDSRVVARSTSGGALKLSLTATSVGLKFINTSGTVVDSTTIPCL